VIVPRIISRAIFLALVSATWLAAQGTITGPTITPSLITFPSPNPDATPTNGSSQVTIQWVMDNNPKGTWSLTVQAPSSSLAGCPAVPVSAIQFTCVSLTTQKEADGQGACVSGTYPLSTGAQIVASGPKEGKTNTSTAVVSFTFTDSWKYPASSSCSVQLIYTITAQ